MMVHIGLLISCGDAYMDVMGVLIGLVFTNAAFSFLTWDRLYITFL